MHLARLLHHVVSLHLLSDHLLPHELLLHSILLHYHGGRRIVGLHVRHLPNMRLLHEIRHSFTVVTLLDHLELVSQHFRLLFAIIALLLQIRNLHVKQPHFTLLVR